MCVRVCVYLCVSMCVCVCVYVAVRRCAPVRASKMRDHHSTMSYINPCQPVCLCPCPCSTHCGVQRPALRTLYVRVMSSDPPFFKLTQTCTFFTAFVYPASWLPWLPGSSWGGCPCAPRALWQPLPPMSKKRLKFGT